MSGASLSLTENTSHRQSIIDAIITIRDDVATGRRHVRNREFESLAAMATPELLDVVSRASRYQEDPAMRFVCATMALLADIESSKLGRKLDKIPSLRDWINMANSLGYYSLAAREATKVWPSVEEAFAARLNRPALDTIVGLCRVYGKALRLCGKYDSAAAVYRLALRKCGEENEPYLGGQLILALGKTAHTNLWRAGYYRCLTSFAERRFRSALRANKSDRAPILRHIGICIDSEAMLELELASALESDAKVLTLAPWLERAWRRALWHARESASDNSQARMLCRSSYALFTLSRIDGDTRKLIKAVTRFRPALAMLENEPTERRGLAVRYGQFAEMMAAQGDFEAADDFLDRAISESRLTRDWRTLAANYLRSVRIMALRGEAPGKAKRVLELALKCLEQLAERLPELEIRILRALAEHCWAIQDYSASETCLERMQQILEGLETRLINDIAVFDTDSNLPFGRQKLDDSGSYVPSAVLATSEQLALRTSLFIDFRLYARSAQHLFQDLSSARELASRRVTTLRQIEFYYDLFQGYAHRIKGRLQRRITTVQMKVAELADESPNAISRTKVREITAQLDDERAALASDFVALLSGVDGLPEGTASYTSVAAVFRNHIGEEPDVRSTGYAILFKGVQFTVEVSSNFFIHCHEEVLNLVIGNLLDNAAREASRVADRRKAVRARVSWTEDGNQYGVIEILDTGYRIQRLELALRAGWTGGTYGLPHANAFFGSFLGTMSVGPARDESRSGEVCEWTCLRIELPFSDRVRQIV